MPATLAPSLADAPPTDDDLAVDLSSVFEPRPPVFVPQSIGQCVCLGGTVPCVPAVAADGFYRPTCFLCRNRMDIAGLCRNRLQYIASDSGTWRCSRCLLVDNQCPSCGIRWASSTDARPCECEPTPRRPTGYHSGRSAPGMQEVATFANRLTGEDDPLIGFEVECVPRYVPDGTTLAHPDVWQAIDDAAGHLIASIESDSSVRDPEGRPGAEIVTMPFALPLWQHMLPDLYAAFTPIASAAHTACGGHIHISKIPALVIGARVVGASYANPAQRPVWDAVAGRPLGSYCTEPPQAPVIQPTLPTRTGNAALCFGSSGLTIEWRHPAGTDDARIALGRAQLIVDVLRHAHEHHRTAPTVPWGWGLYLRDRPAPTPDTIYAFALLRSLGY